MRVGKDFTFFYCILKIKSSQCFQEFYHESFRDLQKSRIFAVRYNDVQMPHTEQQSQHAAKPFLKWAGGKSQLLAQFDQHLPESLEERNFTYIEPFVRRLNIYYYIYIIIYIYLYIIINYNHTPSRRKDEKRKYKLLFC